MSEQVQGTVRIPVHQLEFDGKTIWIHGRRGTTVLRIKVEGGITVSKCGDNPSSHLDLRVLDAANFCLSDDAVG